MNVDRSFIHAKSLIALKKAVFPTIIQEIMVAILRYEALHT